MENLRKVKEKKLYEKKTIFDWFALGIVVGMILGFIIAEIVNK